MRYHERLNIVFMLDNGPRRGFRIRRSHFYLLLIVVVSLPFLCLILALQCWTLWRDNSFLRENTARIENEVITAENRARRLETLETLLNEENLSVRDILSRRAASAKKTAPTVAETPETSPAQIDGPGHEEFPAADTGRVKVTDVRVRITRGHSLRVSLDLRNPAADEVLNGEVKATLATADGEKYDLTFVPRDAGAFRINRFKRAVLTASVPRAFKLQNSEVIVEITDAKGETMYRNIFAVSR